MPIFKLPLAGDVVQTINPWTAIFQPVGGQYGLINIHLGQSAAPKVEEQVLTDVGTYGRQLGRIGDVVEILMRKLKSDLKLNEDERQAFRDLREMLEQIRAIKEKVGKESEAALRSEPKET